MQVLHSALPPNFYLHFTNKVVKLCSLDDRYGPLELERALHVLALSTVEYNPVC